MGGFFFAMIILFAAKGTHTHTVEALPQRTTRSRHDHTRYNHNRRMAEGKERSDSGRPLTETDEPARHEVNGGDVVCIERMAEAEAVRESSRGDEYRVEAEDDGGDDPNEEIDGEEERYDGDGLRGQSGTTTGEEAEKGTEDESHDVRLVGGAMRGWSQEEE